ncbi:SIR2 family protein [Streptomyces sp. NPDC013178]|uniref:P-loop NTPase n=1 Tax=Streptomyces sp. NPDC013178 TaxID=3155118 RepID=UPI0033D83391
MNTVADKPGEEKELVYRLRSLLSETDKPVAFIVGSGVSIGAVDGVGAIVRDMRRRIGDPGETALFDAKVTGPTDGERYQQGAEFAQNNRDQDWLNLVIRHAVLGACPDLTPEEREQLARASESELQQIERDASRWRLTPATEALGRLLHLLPKERRGPVITTNFDPLLEIAVRRAGALALPQEIDLDGKLSRSEDEEIVDIAHVHGYWRKGDTLHTVFQLQRPRPLLHGSLRNSLSGHTVIVVGYSGWDDAFSRSLREHVQEQERNGVDLIWCSYDPLTEASFSSGLLKELVDAPRKRFYHEVDAGRLFPAVVDAYEKALERPPGWLRLDRALLDDMATTTPAREDVVGFFDGAEPDWSTALDTRVPRLSLVAELTEAVRTCLAGGDERIVAAVGPMGEGKSMALRQATVDLVRERDDLTVFWRERGEPFDAEPLLAVPARPGRRVLLVSDDGALVVDGVRRLMTECRAQGRTDIHVLLAAQEWEWRNRRAWNELGRFTADIVSCHGLTERDGAELVSAWDRFGALGELAATPADERVRKLVDLSAESYGKQESSLVGAMLKLRYDGKLGRHVDDLLRRMDTYPPIGDRSLRQSFLMIALLHAAFAPRRDRIRPLSVRILAQALGVRDTFVRMSLEDALRKEAAISEHGEDLWVRHHSIAETALDLSREQSPGELETLIRPLVRAAVSLSSTTGAMDDDLYSVAYLSSRLQKQRWSADEYLAAAEAAVAAAPTRLSYRTSHVSALRTAKRRGEALSAAEEAWAEINQVADPESMIGFLLEWGTAAGQAGHPESNALLDCLALPYCEEPARVVWALVNLGVPLTQLHRRGKDPVFLDALRGVVGLLSERRRTRREDSFLAKHDDYVSGRGAVPLTGDDAWDAVQTAFDALRPSAHSSLTSLVRSAGSIRPPERL